MPSPAVIPPAPPRYMLSPARSEALRSAVARIVKLCAARYAISPRMVRSRCKTQRVAWVRHLAMALCYEVTNASTIELGELFRRDHTSVMWAAKSVRNACDVYPAVREEFSALLALARKENA